MSEYTEKLKKVGINFCENKSLSEYCTYGVGGNASVIVFPENAEQLKVATDCEKYEIVGCGSNVLFSDEGFDGAVINTRKMNKITVRGVTLSAECGALLSDVLRAAELNCLTGLEFTEGIPATIGGAVCMNAGCFSKSISETIAYVVTDKQVYNNSACRFGYRKSVFSELNPKEAIFSACFLLKPGESDLIEQKREHFRKLRKSSQPKGRTCGSVFVNDGYFAGKVIDSAGLKGFRMGGASVSLQHANFIINENGTASDIYKLIKFIKAEVFRTQNIKLSEELRYIGKFDD